MKTRKTSQKKTIKTDINDDCKLVFCVRNDLKMGKGKIAAQCGHATVMCLLKSQKTQSKYLDHWLKHAQTKVALRVDSLEELDALYAKAREAGLVCGRVVDAGRTQIESGSVTVVGIGPAPIEMVNKITGHLKLLN